jgi:hypothetical protein
MTRADRDVGEATRSCGRTPREDKSDAGSAKRRARRHLEGWELGVVALGIASLAAALVVPRGAEPDLVPPPRVDRQEVRRVLAVERERAAEAAADPLPYEVRAAGEALRQYGRAEAARDPTSAEAKLRELRRATQIARSIFGDPLLLRLRAAQSMMFLSALERWEAGAESTLEIEELGGSFLEKARRSGWLASPRRLEPTLAERMTLFRIRWSELTGLREEGQFSPSANEWRLYYRFLLEHPEPGASGAESLGYVSAAKKYDPEYPALLAVGIIELRSGRPARAIEALSDYLAEKPSGRWRLRAQNHLARALAQVEPAEH